MHSIPSDPVRKPYVAPRLVELGAVEQLTGQKLVGTGTFEEQGTTMIPTDGRPFVS